ncbi:hypothetical protein BH09PAT2_BH09PAT2_01460 [soil metagenome]
MKISFLNFDLSNNSLGRAYILAKMLSRKYEVEIIGPQFGNSIWSPVAKDTSIPYIMLSDSLRDLKNNLKKIDGDIIYAIKPYGTSYGYALVKKFINKKPVILDEDDWDFGFFLDKTKKQLFHDIFHIDLFNINNPLYTYLFGKLAFLADDITVSSSFLQRKFGGTIIPHARDAAMFNVNSNEVEKLKKKYNSENKTIIMFFGSVRKHKGIDIIVNALDRLDTKNILFMIVGVNEESQKIIPQRLYIKTLPTQDFTKLPAILSMADLVILPQKKSPATVGQIPAKVFDAMALGKPIIASDVSDLPLILKDCGLIFKAEDSADLQNRIEFVLQNPNEAKILGIKAKEKFNTLYSFDSVEKNLFKIVDTIIQK